MSFFPMRGNEKRAAFPPFKTINLSGKQNRLQTNNLL